MNAKLRELIWQRAGYRCEYCRLHRDESYFAFHIEHIIARQHQGSNESGNLCLACAECNQFKGTNIAGIIEGNIYPLFNPRTQSWGRHFEWDNTTLVGRTNCGRATVKVLRINLKVRIQLREQLLFEGRFLPPG